MHTECRRPTLDGLPILSSLSVTHKKQTGVEATDLQVRKHFDKYL
jgi:hypothetical protein